MIIKNLPDGSFLAKIYPSERDSRHDLNGIEVRLIEYRIKGKDEIMTPIMTPIILQ